MTRSQISGRFADRGPESLRVRRLSSRAAVGAAIGLAALGALTGAIVTAAPSDSGSAAPKSGEAPWSESVDRADMPPIDRVRADFDRMRDHGDVLTGLACDGDWFDWQRLDRNWPLGENLPQDINSFYGISVAVSGNVAVVGASFQHVPFFPPFGDDPNPIPVPAGAAYVFRFVDGDWVRVARLTAPQSSIAFGPIRFGRSVAVASSPDMDIVVVGAPDEPYLGLELAGAAYVFHRTGPTYPLVEQESWRMTSAANARYWQDLDNPEIIYSHQFRNDFPFELGRFGWSVGILPFRQTPEGWEGGDKIVIGGVNTLALPHCEDPDEVGFLSGSVAYYKRNGIDAQGDPVPLFNWWAREQTLVAECIPLEQFGASVSLIHSAERGRPLLIVGSDRGLVRLPDPKDPKEEILIPDAGAAYIFDFDPPDKDTALVGRSRGRSARAGDDEKDEDPGPWVLDQRLHSPEPFPFEFYGRAVALSTSPIERDVAFVGAVHSHAFGVDDNGNPIGEGFEGAVYVYCNEPISGAVLDEPETHWVEKTKLISPLAQIGGEFGHAIAVSGNTVVVGAFREGFEDPLDDDEFLDAVGFAYRFTSDGSAWDNGEIILPYGPDTMQPFDQFGISAAMDGGVLVIGAASMNFDVGEVNEFPNVGAAFTYGRCFDCESDNSCFQSSPSAGCNAPSCCNLVCQFDPFCCEVAWDEDCVDLAMGMPSQCGFPTQNCPGTGSCCDVNGTPGCTDGICCEVVCAIDSFCCESDWDSCCVALAQAECDLCPPVPGPSCAGLCGLPDVDGCGTCSCAPDCFLEGNCCDDICIECAFPECNGPAPPSPSAPDGAKPEPLDRAATRGILHRDPDHPELGE
jgi:hypothetical protein